MTLQTYKANLLAHEHARVRRTVRLMTGAAALETHRRMLERERSAQIAVALEARLFISRYETHHAGLEAAVGIVTIYARHGPFRNPMPERTLKLRQDIGVASAALFIDGSRLSRHHTIRTMRVNAVARRACYLILGVAALDAANLRGTVEVACEASLVDGDGVHLGGIQDIRGSGGI